MKNTCFNKNKGFTLIELLASIVIIAILSLIIVPTALNIIEKSRKNTFKNSMYGLIRTTDMFVASEKSGSLIGALFTCNGISCSLPDGRSLTIDGEAPTAGDIKVREENVELLFVEKDGFCALGTKYDMDVKRECNKLDVTDAELTTESVRILKTSINTITVQVTTRDIESGIKTIKFYVNGVLKETKNYENPFLSEGTEAVNKDYVVAQYQFKDLQEDSEHTIKIEVTNGNNRVNNVEVKSETGTMGTTIAGVKTPSTPANGYNGYVLKQVITASFSKKNITEPGYFIKSTRTENINAVQLQACGTSTEPTSCGEVTSVTKLIKNTWYKLPTTSYNPVLTSIEITYDEAADLEDTFYTIAYDGERYIDASTYTLSKIDTTAPITNGVIARKTTTTATIKATCIDNESGLKKIEFSKDNGSTWVDNGLEPSYTFGTNKEGNPKLIPGTIYKFKVRCTNELNLVETTDSITGTMTTLTLTPSSTIWTISKTVTITSENLASNAEIQYKVVSVPENESPIVKTDWTKYTGDILINWTANISTPTVVYVRVYDGASNYGQEQTLTITTVDITPSEASGTIANKTTTTATILATCVDNDSPITKIEFSKDNGSTWVDNGTTTSYTFGTGATGNPALLAGGEYNFKVRCANGPGTKTTSSSINGTMTTLTLTPSSTIWTTSKTVTITSANLAGNAEIQYKVVSGSTIKTNWTSYTGAISINWAANTTTPTVVYTRVYDGASNYGLEQSLTITTVDVTSPSQTSPSVSVVATAPTSQAVATFRQTDGESDIDTASIEYGISTSENGTYRWQTDRTFIKDENNNLLIANTTYYFRTRVRNIAQRNSGEGLTVSSAQAYTTSSITSLGACTVAISNNGTWTTSKTASASNPGVGTLQWKIVSGTTVKLDWTNYSSTGEKTIDWIATSSTPTYVYCRVVDGGNIRDGASSVATTTVDPTKPTGQSISAYGTSDGYMNVYVGGNDYESGIWKYVIYYGTSLYNLSSSTEITSTSTTLGLSPAETYYFMVRVYNNAGNYIDSSVTSGVKSCSWYTSYNSSYTSNVTAYDTAYAWATDSYVTASNVNCTNWVPYSYQPTKTLYSYYYFTAYSGLYKYPVVTRVNFACSTATYFTTNTSTYNVTTNGTRISVTLPAFVPPSYETCNLTSYSTSGTFTVYDWHSSRLTEYVPYKITATGYAPPNNNFASTSFDGWSTNAKSWVSKTVFTQYGKRQTGSITWNFVGTSLKEIVIPLTAWSELRSVSTGVEYSTYYSCGGYNTTYYYSTYSWQYPYSSWPLYNYWWHTYSTWYSCHN